MSYEYDCTRALRISMRHARHADAIREIILVGFAADAGEADEMISEGERQRLIKEGF